MPVYLGLDIGSNSVGSAWVDTDEKSKEITLGVSIFPAGVEQREDRRGKPKNQNRRAARSQRKTHRRRSIRKIRLREDLTQAQLLPSDPEELRKQINHNPWHLRREGLRRELSPYEFGRLLVHLNQRRGAVGIKRLPEKPEEDEDDREDQKAQEGRQTKRALGHTEQEMKTRGAQTFGQMMADLIDERRREINGKIGRYSRDPIRNRNDRLVERSEEALYADREMIRQEFCKLWEKQKSFAGELAQLLTDDLYKKLDDSECELYHDKTKKAWRHGGVIFGQRQTYWDTGTLGRCDLEPTDHKCPKADMHAQEFRLLDFVNNLRIREGGIHSKCVHPLNEHQRATVLDLLRKPQLAKSKGEQKVKASFDIKDLKKVLKIDKKTLTKRGLPENYFDFTVSHENGQDEDIKVVTDWFYRDIVCGVLGEETWQLMSGRQRESVNRAILKFDPNEEKHIDKLRKGAIHWWALDTESADRLVNVWRQRPKVDDRLNLSRKAIRNLLSIMRRPDPERRDEFPNQIRARKLLAEDSNCSLTTEQRVRYAPKLTPEFKELLKNLVGEKHAKQVLKLRGLNKGGRHYLEKHADTLLPPAPMITNPVVRKAIHEVRNHVLAHLQKHRKPDGTFEIPHRIVIELAREGRQSAKVRDAIYAKNKAREKIRKAIIEQHGLHSLTRNQQRRAVERVLLCRQQNFVCPYTNFSEEELKKKDLSPDGKCVYTGKSITERQAVEGVDVEIDHIVPYSKSGDDSINNKVLCYKEVNQRKGDNTPKDFLGGDDSEAFKAMEQRMRHLNIPPKGKGPPKSDYFTKKDYRRKWQNLHRDPAPNEFRNSQLSDTAYAAKEVGDYLRAALYEGEADGKQKVFFTNGKLTSRLRNDWLLYRELRELIGKNDPEAKEKDERNRQRSIKDRGDHRHHAIDAVVIALTTDYINKIVQDEKYREEYYQRAGHKVAPKRMTQPKPWESLGDFRRDALSQLFETFDGLSQNERTAEGQETGKEFIVSHVPEKRRLVGALHKEKPLGRTKQYSGLYTFTISADPPQQGAYLKPSSLKAPKPIESANGFIWRIEGRGQTSVVADEGLRKEIIHCLSRNEKDPENFSKQDLKELVQAGKFCMRSGVPINKVTMMRTLADPLRIVGKDGVERFYQGGNNHHLEILKDFETGKLTGHFWDTFRVARRIRPPKGLPRLPMVIGREMERFEPDELEEKLYALYEKTFLDDEEGRAKCKKLSRLYRGKEFVMSLAIGEILRIRHKKKGSQEPGKPGYFTVFEVNAARQVVGLTPHWDARRAKGKGVENPREELEIRLQDFQRLGVGGEESPYPVKVRVSPLGKITPLIND